MSVIQNALYGALRIPLVGRETIVQDILRDYKRCTGPNILYLLGEGGVGKSAILEAVLNQAREDLAGNERYLVADHLIDLFHVEYQTKIGLAQEIAELFPAGYSHMFSKFRHLLKESNDEFRRHNSLQAESLREEAEESFIKSLNELSKDHILLLILDTVERFQLIRSMKSSVENWLFSTVLPKLDGKIFLILAGREQDQWGNKSEVRDDILGLRPQWKIVSNGPKPIPALDKAACREYLKSVSEYIISDKVKEKDEAGSRRIARYLRPERIELIYQVTHGKPLRLALMSDILRVGGNLPWEIQPDAGRPILEEDVDKALLGHLLDTNSPFVEILRYMSYLTRGTNESMLSRVILGTPMEKIKEWMEFIGTLAIIKTRPGRHEFPYFLHDEVYRLFEKYFPLTDRGRIHQKIHAYYDEQIRKIELAQASSVDPYNYAVRRRQMLIERVHYDIWVDASMGFVEYFVRQSDAIDTRSEDFYLSLLNETMRSIQDIPNESTRAVFSRHLRVDVSLREVELLLQKNQYDKAEHQLVNLEKIWQNNLEYQPVPPLYRIYFQLVFGVMHYKKNNFKESEIKFDHAIEMLQLLKSDPDIGMASKAARDYIEGIAKNYLSLIARKRGQHAAALKQARRSVNLLNNLKTDNSSGAIINLAYAMVMVGNERTARTVIQRAIQAARRAHNDLELARIYNVRLFIESRVPDFDQAMHFGEKALAILETQPSALLEGYVCLNLSRAYRYRWNTQVADNELSDWRTYLLRGLAYIEGPQTVQEFFNVNNINIASSKGALALLQQAKSPLSYVEALNEAGCHWREVAWATTKNKEEFKARECTRRAIKHFLSAAGIKDENQDWLIQIRDQIRQLDQSPHLPSLALVNLGWAYHYQKDTSAEEIYRLCSLIEQIIDEHGEYLWKKDGTPPGLNLDSGEMLRWAVLGKMEMLRCHQMLRDRGTRDLSEGARQELIRKAALHATLSLEYNYYMGRSTYDLRRAEENIERRIMQSEDWEHRLLPAFYQGAVEAAKHIRSPKASEKGKTRLLRKLDESFGPPSDWIARTDEA